MGDSLREARQLRRDLGYELSGNPPLLTARSGHLSGQQGYLTSGRLMKHRSIAKPERPRAALMLTIQLRELGGDDLHLLRGQIAHRTGPLP
ncbi:hypothetical protein [Streptomyces sp. NPDC053431]|uniref:hypothetical protein n=1 Tax=Streptomyces sp. NPDC053431 TaxID=3365703 RepID=UPI0037D0BA70